MRALGPALIAFSLVVAFAAGVGAIIFRGPNVVDTWAVIAACLSVWVGAISAYASQRSSELIEREIEPDVSIALIPRHLSGDKHLRLVNLGRSSAFEVTVEWQAPPPLEAHEKAKSIRQLRRFEDMEYELPASFRNSLAGYKAIIRWRDANKKAYEAVFETTDDELKFIARANAEDGVSGKNRQLDAIQRELHQMRSDQKAEHQNAMQQLGQFFRQFRR